MLKADTSRSTAGPGRPCCLAAVVACMHMHVRMRVPASRSGSRAGRLLLSASARSKSMRAHAQEPQPGRAAVADWMTSDVMDESSNHTSWPGGLFTVSERMLLRLQLLDVCLHLNKGFVLSLSRRVRGLSLAVVLCFIHHVTCHLLAHSGKPSCFPDPPLTSTELLMPQART